MQAARKVLEDFLFNRVYRHYQVNRTFKLRKD